MPAADILEWSTENCTLARAAAVFGDRASLLVLRDVSSGVRRFDDMRERTGMPRQVLSNRLAMLVDAEILVRHPYREPGQRARYEYRFTEKGIDLIPILVAFFDWGSAHLADPAGPPVEVVHKDCDGQVHVVLACEHGHSLEGGRQTRVRPGPGAVRR